MKSNKRVKLILIFGLVLLMLFATVACDRDDKAPNATDETRARRTKATETLETEPSGESAEETTTVDPEATEPESTEPESTEDDGASITTEKYDPSKDPENIVTTEALPKGFSQTLPAEFKGSSAIKIPGSNCEIYTFRMLYKGGDRYDMAMLGATAPEGGGSANGVTKLTASESPASVQEQVYHYYINKAATASDFVSSLPIEECYIRWSFTLPESGVYKVASYHRIKADSRSGFVHFDNGSKYRLEYSISQNQYFWLADQYAGAYWVWDQTFELAAGTHTLTYTDDDNHSIHWRDIYLVKVGNSDLPPIEAPQKTYSMPSDFDNDNDGSNDSFTFTNYLPERFAASNAITVAGADHLSTDVGVGSLVVGDYTHYYVNLDAAGDDSAKYISWKVNIPEDGIYDVCFQMRMKDGALRANEMLIDGFSVYKMNFQFSNGFETHVQDNSYNLNSYMTGMKVALKAGEHTVKMRAIATYPKTFHFRYLYFVKVGEIGENWAPSPGANYWVDMPSSFDNNNDGTLDSFTFSNYLPDRFLAVGTFNIGAVHHNESDIGVNYFTVENRTHYYVDLADTSIEDSAKYISWNVIILESGTYDIGFEMRMKDGAHRANEMFIDDVSVYKTDFQFFNGTESLVRDDSLSSYMTGMEVYLTEGEHVIKMKAIEGFPKTFHFRSIYLTKVAELPAK